MRVFLGGRDVPRDEFALEGIGAGSANVGIPVVLLMENGEIFTPGDYISLGYTHFEVWCVGAAGGFGGGASSRVEFDVVRTNEVMPDWMWARHLESAWYQYALSQYYNPNQFTFPDQAAFNASKEAGNPTHTFQIHTYSNPHLVSVPGPGGGSGGGGLHVVSGELTTLPEEIPVTVGQPGAHGAHGQDQVNGLWTPDPMLLYWTGQRHLWYDPSAHQWVLTPVIPGDKIPGVNAWAPENVIFAEGLDPYRLETVQLLRDWFVRYPSPQSIPMPQPGADGGYSAFGDICQASGGKGGRPTKVWGGSSFVEDGDGGAGGVGNTIVAGGGGEGAPDRTKPGKDGLWDRVSVGQGGGGGHAPWYSIGGGGGSMFPGALGPIAVSQPGTPGGRGSFSYGDTSIYGATDRDVGGGGARILRKYPRGARVLRYEPNGGVVIRLRKIVV